MALPADFSKIFGSIATGGLTPIGDVNYAKGWEFVGSNPPTKNDFSYLQNLSDRKSEWLYSNKLQRTDPFGDIKSDGTVKTALENLSLGAGAPAIGIPFFWPSAAMPNTVMDEWSDMVFLKFNGATFSAATYPKLALVFPALVLPEARGEFLRIFDDGRGIDTGRVLLSSQSSGAPNIIGSIEGRTSISGGRIFQKSTSANGAFQTTMEAGEYAESTTTGASPDDRRSVLKFDASLSTAPGAEVYGTGATEVRPRNIAFNFLVRAK